MLKWDLLYIGASPSGKAHGLSERISASSSESVHAMVQNHLTDKPKVHYITNYWGVAKW